MAKTRTRPWDVVEHLKTEDDKAAYLEAALAGVVAELAGVIKKADIGEPRAEYTEYLLKKYS